MTPPKLKWLLAVLLLGACSEQRPPDHALEQQSIPPQPAAAVTGTQPPPAEPAAAAPLLPPAYDLIKARFGDLDELVAQRAIRVLTVYGSGRYYIDNASEKGLVSEASRHFARFINRRLKRSHAKVQVIVIPVARNQLIPALLAGRGDLIMAGVSITPQRQQQVDFSIAASKPLAEILVTGPSAPALTSIDDLAGHTLYVRASSSYRESVQALNQRLQDQGSAPVHIETVSELLEDEDLAEMVNAGLLPWAIVDDYKMTWWKGVFANLTVRDDIVFRQGGQIAWALRKDSPQLKQAVNDFLRRNREGTLIGNVLKNKYVRDFDWAAHTLSDDDYHRFRKLGTLFRQYGTQYHFDPLMIAAQAYQESRLRQSARSHAGAIGVMQIKASTARDRNVNIRNIHNVEPNIHAGTKYLSFLRERYFSSPDIDPLNRTLLSLAAYNMGPARMIRLRNKASQQGYDPNIWFDNVELVAAREVGREPVQYVGNIYRHYIHLRLTEQGALPYRRQARQIVQTALSEKHYSADNANASVKQGKESPP